MDFWLLGDDRLLAQWVRHIVGLPILALALLGLSGCGATLFQFDDTAPLNQPPPPAQKVGTANVDGPPGSVVMVASPSGSGGRWVKITRTATQTSVSGLQCNLIRFAGDGDYTISCTLIIPSGAGLATLQFEPFGQDPHTVTSGLHLDFTEDNRVRIDDNDATKFGSFQRDRVFLVQVKLKINATPTAHIDLVGANASGSADYAVTSLAGILRQFGAVRVWMGFPWTGSFDATAIVVKKE
jgi:hypothetical protein